MLRAGRPCFRPVGLAIAGLGLGVVVAGGALAVACSQRGDAPSPGGDELGADATAGDDADAASYTICPDSIDASYGSIAQNLFMSLGCTSICHITAGASLNGDLDFTVDAAAIYRELLGSDGGGVPASNMQGTARLLRVDPYDPDASLLYIKLNLHSDISKLYGSGMPGNAPGTVCPMAVDAVRTWIDEGATFAGGVRPEDAGVPEASAADGHSPAD